MTSASNDVPASSACSGHVRAFFRGEEEEYRRLLPLARECAHSGYRCIHIVDAQHQSERMLHLQESGIDLVRLGAMGRLQVRNWDAMSGGKWDVKAQLDAMGELVRRADLSVPAAHIWAGGDRGLSGEAGWDDWIEFECMVNPILAANSAFVVCTYDLRRHDARMVLDLLHTHPLVLTGGTLRANGLFVPPEELLPELRARRGGVQE
jgi:hypothetical protein